MSDWSPDSIRALRDRLGLSRLQFGQLLLGAEAKRADGYVARLEEPDRADACRPTRPVLVLLRWIDAGGKPPDWDQVVGPRPSPSSAAARSSARQGQHPHGSR